MSRKSLGSAFVIMLAASPASWALGLGDIRLASTLNAPLAAEIEVLGAAPDELSSLKAQLASRDTFARYGLEWPSFLSSVTLTRARSADGRDVLVVRSAESITEPFVTLLIEVNWSRGRLVREYTVLLDPPVYSPGSTTAQAAPVAAPTTSAPRSGAVERSPPPAPSAEEPSSSSAPASGGGGTYRVRRGDSLSAIARQLADGASDAQRTMVAIYRGNPDAFEGNMNLLRAGAVLRVPDAGETQAIGAGEAASEVRRQYSAWRATSSSAGGADEPGRLRLVAPAEPGTGGSAASTAELESLRGRVRDLEGQLSESKRLLEVRNAELANLQAKLAAPAAAPAAPVAPAPEAMPTEPPPAEVPAATASTEPAPDAAPPAAEPPAATEPASTPATKPRRAEKPASDESTGGGLLDTLLGFWWVLLIPLLGLAALFGFRKFKERQTTSFDDQLGQLSGDTSSADVSELRSDTAKLRQPTGRNDDAFLVEESGSHERPAFPDTGDSGIRKTPRNVTADDTISSETAINLDQGDPLAEADFHMAYGLYDQAADLVRMAIAREPDRRDLKLKLLEVFFVWGNKDQFLSSARQLAESRAEAAPGEWEKIVIMGRQLAPDEPLFAQSAGLSGAAAAGVDLDLEGGQNRIDFDLVGESGEKSGIDLDLGADLAAAGLADKDPTGEAKSPTVEESLDFVLDDPGLAEDHSGNTTREMTQELSPRRESEVPTGSFLAADSGEAPTVEQPALRGADNPTIRQKVEHALRQNQATDHTAELALDDLGLDLGAMEGDTQNNAGPDAPTMVSGLDATSQRMMAEAEKRTLQDGTAPSETGTWFIDDQDVDGEQSLDVSMDAGATAQLQALHAQTAVLPDASATSQIAALQVDDLDLDLGAIGDDAEKAPATNGAGVDLDVGSPTQVAPAPTMVATQKLAAEDLALPELEPVTMSEVGTKLDLARAYMDMGDPEGAKNILHEVLQEGSVSQKQEAQRLIESLPG